MSDEEKKEYWAKIRDMDGPQLLRFGWDQRWTREQWQAVQAFRERYRPTPRVDMVQEAMKVFPGSRVAK